MPWLAAWTPASDTATVPEAMWRRVINACFRMGERRHVERVIDLAADQRLSDNDRREALAALEDWSVPDDRDRVTGFWRPLAPRDPRIVRSAVTRYQDTLPDQLPADLKGQAIRLLASLRLRPIPLSLQRWLDRDSSPTSARVEAARLLSTVYCEGTDQLLEIAVTDELSAVRTAARQALARWKPNVAVRLLKDVVLHDSAELRERQEGVRLLGGLSRSDADEILASATRQLEHGKWPSAITLELLEAARERPALTDRVKAFSSSREGQAPVDQFDYLLHGGDAVAGRQIFYDHLQAQCARCHRLGLNGGTAGPKLDGIVTRHPNETRRYLLESILEPNAKLAEGYEQAVIVLDSGLLVSGRVIDETDERLTVESGDGVTTTIDKTKIEERRHGVSPMPALEKVLTHREIRDLVEFLASLK